MRGSRFATDGGVNAWEMRARSFVWRGGSTKISQSGPLRELNVS
jgi:hypothetical protein